MITIKFCTKPYSTFLQRNCTYFLNKPRTLGPTRGFGGLVVSMLASGTQDRGFAPDRQHAFLRRGSKIICPVSQLWGMKKNSTIFVNSEIVDQIQLVSSFASRMRCVSG
jgi:hypothetical protein